MPVVRCSLLSIWASVDDVPTANDSSKDMTSSPFANMPPPAGPQDFVKLFKAEKDNLEFSEGVYTWSGNDVEERILRKYGKLPPKKI